MLSLTMRFVLREWHSAKAKGDNVDKDNQSKQLKRFALPTKTLLEVSE